MVRLFGSSSWSVDVLGLLCTVRLYRMKGFTCPACPSYIVSNDSSHPFQFIFILFQFISGKNEIIFSGSAAGRRDLQAIRFLSQSYVLQKWNRKQWELSNAYSRAVHIAALRNPSS